MSFFFLFGFEMIRTEASAFSSDTEMGATREDGAEPPG